jgi:predicted RNA-binding Zn-ribbon protein involved in translation (DUF1610 family)
MVSCPSCQQRMQHRGWLLHQNRSAYWCPRCGTFVERIPQGTSGRIIRSDTPARSAEGSVVVSSLTPSPPSLQGESP